MLTIQTNVVMSPGGILAITIPKTVTPGVHKVVVVIEEKAVSVVKRTSKKFPVHSVGVWPKSLSLRREDMYDNEGR